MECSREKWMKFYPHHCEKMRILNINANPEAHSHVLVQNSNNKLFEAGMVLLAVLIALPQDHRD